jgi:hypothetical protein
MNPMRRRQVVVALPLFVAAVVATSACDIAMSELRQKETAEWRKTYDVKPGGRLEISNVNGKIDVEPAAGNTVEVVAEKSVRAASVEAAKDALSRIEIQENVAPDSVRIETKCRGGRIVGSEPGVHYMVSVAAGLEVRRTNRQWRNRK